MKRKELNSLNKLLQGEHMAVEAFNTYIDKLENENDKKVFQVKINIKPNTVKSNPETVAVFISIRYVKFSVYSHFFVKIKRL